MGDLFSNLADSPALIRKIHCCPDRAKHGGLVDREHAALLTDGERETPIFGQGCCLARREL